MSLAAIMTMGFLNPDWTTVSTVALGVIAVFVLAVVWSLATRLGVLPVVRAGRFSLTWDRKQGRERGSDDPDALCGSSSDNVLGAGPTDPDDSDG